MSKLRSHLACLIDPATGELWSLNYPCAHYYRFNLSLLFAVDEKKLKAAQEVSENLEVSVFQLEHTFYSIHCSTP